jgi:hypothetical protein
MSKFVLIARLMFVAIVSATVSTAPLSSAIAHEGEEHGMECNEASINEMNMDIQAMDDGETKTNAMKEMHMAGDMMAKKDMKACMDHMHKAKEMMEK